MEVAGDGAALRPVLPSVGTTPTQERRWHHLQNYDVLKTIGEGTFAKVKLGIHRPTRAFVAIKIIDRKHLQKDDYAMKHWQREANIMKLLVHRNIIQLLEVLDSPRETYLIMEFADGGELKQLIKTRGKLPEKEVVNIFRQVISALEYCHGLNIVHRDLKAENVLLTKNNLVKLTDFNLSNYFSRSSYLMTCCGSPAYAAPELIEGKKYVGPEVDVWSLGVNMFYALAGHLPFTEASEVLSSILLKQPMKRASLAKLKGMQLLIMYNKSASDLLSNIPTGIEINDRNDIDDSILDEMKNLGYDTNAVVDSLLKNLYDSLSATYKLLLSNKLNKQMKPNPLPTNAMKMFENVSLSSSPVPSPRSLRPRSRTISGVPDIPKRPLIDLLTSATADSTEMQSKPEVGVLKAIILPHITKTTTSGSAAANLTSTKPLSQNNMIHLDSFHNSGTNSHSDPNNTTKVHPRNLQNESSDYGHRGYNQNNNTLSPEMQMLSPLRTRRHSFM